ncbi:MAG: hypothetical protein ABI445_22575 [Polyangia bacterium]
MSEYRDRSYSVVVAMRGNVHPVAYAAHTAMANPANAKRVDGAVIYGKEIGYARCRLFETAIATGAAYALCLDDDVLPPRDIVARLLDGFEAAPSDTAAVSALYCTKDAENLPIILGDPARGADDHTWRRAPAVPGLVMVNAIPLGAALVSLAAIKKVAPPVCVMTDDESEDVNLSRKLTALGFKLYVDTRIRCGHLDVTTGTIY